VVSGAAPGGAGLGGEAQVCAPGDCHGEVVRMYGGQDRSQDEKEPKEKKPAFPLHRPIHDLS
jgi:hypothetical protein